MGVSTGHMFQLCFAHSYPGDALAFLLRYNKLHLQGLHVTEL